MRVSRTFIMFISVCMSVVTGLLITAGSAAGAVTAPAPSPWLQNGYNAANSRANLAETGIDASNVATLRRIRTVVADPTGNCPANVSTPAFSQSRFYAVRGDEVGAYDLTSGRRLWHTRVFSTVGDTDYPWLAVAQGKVFVGTDTCATSDPFGQIKSFDANTGAYLATLKTPGDTLVGMEVFGKYLVAHYACPECNGFAHNTVYRINNGSIAWQTPDDRAQTNVATATSVVNGLAFEIASPDDGATLQLNSYLAYNGAPRWTKSGYYNVLAGDSDTASANNLIVNGDGGVLDLNPRTGATRFALPDVTTNQPLIALDPNRIYASCSPAHEIVCAFSTRDGRLLWQRTDPSGAYGFDLTVANGLVYLDSGLVLSADTGAIVTTLSTHPVLVGSGHVGAYVGGTYDRDRFAVLGLPAG